MPFLARAGVYRFHKVQACSRAYCPYCCYEFDCPSKSISWSIVPLGGVHVQFGAEPFLGEDPLIYIFKRGSFYSWPITQASFSVLIAKSGNLRSCNCRCNLIEDQPPYETYVDVYSR